MPLTVNTKPSALSSSSTGPHRRPPNASVTPTAASVSCAMNSAKILNESFSRHRKEARTAPPNATPSESASWLSENKTTPSMTFIRCWKSLATNSVSPLFGSARHSHVMSSVFDEGLALFAGLNVVPKRSFLTEYSCRIAPSCYPAFMKRWFAAINQLGIDRGVSFDLDFHTIPYHGDDALVEKHYVSKRSRKQKGLLAFLAQDAETRVFCYANGNIRKQDQADEILRFTEFWKERTGKWPQELIFDSKLTTHANLHRLTQRGIDFITLRRRSFEMRQQVYRVPLSAWRRIELTSVTREYRTPRILDQTITLSGYKGYLRQVIIADLGHDEPTFLLTNQLRRSAPQLVGRYAQRMIIENGIADGIDFFHMDALSSAVAMKVDCDLQLTLMASSLYRLLARKVKNGYQRARSRHLFRDFVDATALVTIEKSTIEVRFQKRAHNPLLLAAGFDRVDQRVPWLGNKRLRLVFG